MKFSMKRISALLAGVAMLYPIPAAVAQSEIPEGPITMVVGFAAGGLTDNIARVVAEGLEQQLDRSIVVENRPGAAGNLSSALVSQAPADGQTIYLGAVGLTTTLAVDPESAVANPLTDLSHIGLVAYTANVIVAGPSVTAEDVAELVEQSRSGNGLTFASSGIGGGLHLTGEMFAKLTGANMVHIPYTGSAPAVTDLLGGRVDLQADNVSGALPLIRDGRVRALAVTSPERLAELPDVPTMNELGYPGMEVGAWFGLMAPPNLPEAITDEYAEALNVVLDGERAKDYFELVGLTPMKTESPAEFTGYLVRDAELWSAVVEATGVTLE